MSDLPTTEDIQNLNSQMSQFNKAITDLNKNLLKSSKHFNNIKKSEEEINEQANKAKGLLKSNNKLVSSMVEGFQGAAEALTHAVKPLGTIGSLLAGGGIAAFTAKVVKDIVNLDNTTSRLAARLGKQVQKAELKGAVNAVQRELGATYENAVQLVSTLSEARYTDNLAEAAKGAEAFGRFTGIGASETATLMNELNKGAGMSTDSINAMLAGMMKVQNNVGLSKAGMLGVSEYIKKAAVNMAAFGKSSSDIQRMATQTTALVASLEKVGVAAGDATELVDRLTDPDRIEDNILLYSQLGVSMEEALSGNVDLSSMDSQLQAMAQRIVDMGPIAGAQFAKSMGMSYKQATQMAKMEGNQVGEVAEQAQTAEEGAIDAMKELEKQAMGVGEKAENLFNRLEGRLRGLPVMIQLGLAVVASYAMKKIKEVYSAMNDKKQASIITDAIGSSVAQGFSKGLEIAKEKTSTAVVTIGRQLKQNYEAFMPTFFSSAEKKIDALTAKAKKETFADIYFGAALENSKNSFEAQLKDYDAKLADLKKKFTDVGGKLDKNGDFKQANIGEGLDPATKKALKAIQEEGEAYEALQKKKQHDLEKYLFKYDKVAYAQYKLNEVQEEANKIQEKINTQKDIQSDCENQILSNVKEINSINEMLNNSSKGQNKLSKEQKAVLEAQKKNLINNNNELKEAKDKAIEILDKEKENLAILEKKVSKRKEEVEEQKQLGQELSGASKIFKGLKMKVGAKIKDSFDKSTFGHSYNKVKAEGGSTKKAVAAGAGKVMANGFKSITKMLGPMAIVMAIFGKLIDKVKEPLQKIMDGLVESLSPVVDVLVGILGPVLNTLIKAFMPPILKVTAAILQMLHYILWPLKAILRLLGKLPWLKEDNAFTAVADALDAITGDEMIGALNKAADTIAQGGADIKEAAEKEDKAATIKADGGDLVQIESASVSSKTANSQASSTTQTTTESKSESQLKEMENAKKEKADKQHKATIEEQLILAVNKLVEISNKLDSSLSKPNPWEGAEKDIMSAQLSAVSS